MSAELKPLVLQISAGLTELHKGLQTMGASVHAAVTQAQTIQQQAAQQMATIQRQLQDTMTAVMQEGTNRRIAQTNREQQSTQAAANAGAKAAMAAEGQKTAAAQAESGKRQAIAQGEANAITSALKGGFGAVVQAQQQMTAATQAGYQAMAQQIRQVTAAIQAMAAQTQQSAKGMQSAVVGAMQSLRAPVAPAAADFAQLDAVIARVRNTLISLGVATGVVALGKAAVGAVSSFEDMQLSIASVVAATNTIKDSQGHILTGSTKINAAMTATSGVVKKLQTDALLTTATTGELVRAFQDAVGPASAVGFTLDQTRQLTVQIVQAAGALKMPMAQVGQEIRSILTGDIDQNARLAKTLGITKQNIEEWTKQGKLFEKVTAKFGDFSAAGEKAGRTFSGLVSSLQDVGEAVLRVIGEKATQALEASMGGLLDNLISVKNGVATLNPQLQAFAENVGAAFGKTVTYLVATAKEMAGPIQQFGQALYSVGKFIYDHMDAIKALIIAMVAYKGTLVVAELLTKLQSAWQALNIILYTVKSMLLDVTLAQEGLNVALAANPIGAVALVVGTLAGGLYYLAGAQDRANNATLDAIDAANQHVKSLVDEAAKIETTADQTMVLIGKHDELAAKTNRTKKENAELAKITAQLIKLNPEFATELGNVGNAAISSGKVILKLADYWDKVTSRALAAAEAQMAAASIQVKTEKSKLQKLYDDNKPLSQKGLLYEAQGLSGYQDDSAAGTNDKAITSQETLVQGLEDKLKEARTEYARALAARKQYEAGSSSTSKDEPTLSPNASSDPGKKSHHGSGNGAAERRQEAAERQAEREKTGHELAKEHFGARVTHGYGEKGHRGTDGRAHIHQGFDLELSSGSEVKAALDDSAVNEVITAGIRGNYGNLVEIKNRVTGVVTQYAHLKQLMVKVGDIVTSDQVIGLSGGAKDDPGRGNSTGAHLHFGVLQRAGGSAMDPGKYLQSLQKSKSKQDNDDFMVALELIKREREEAVKLANGDSAKIAAAYEQEVKAVAATTDAYATRATEYRAAVKQIDAAERAHREEVNKEAQRLRKDQQDANKIETDDKRKAYAEQAAEQIAAQKRLFDDGKTTVAEYYASKRQYEQEAKDAAIEATIDEINERQKDHELTLKEWAELQTRFNAINRNYAKQVRTDIDEESKARKKAAADLVAGVEKAFSDIDNIIKTFTDNSKSAWDKFVSLAKAAFDALKPALIEALTPIASQITTSIGKAFADGFASAIKPEVLTGLISGLNGVVKVIGGAISDLIKGIGSAIGGLISALGTMGPWGWIILGVIALAAAITGIVIACNNAAASAKQMGEAFAHALPAGTKAVLDLQDALHGIGKAAQDGIITGADAIERRLQELKNKISDFQNWLAKPVNAPEQTTASLNKLRSSLQKQMETYQKSGFTESGKKYNVTEGMTDEQIVMSIMPKVAQVIDPKRLSEIQQDPDSAKAEDFAKGDVGFAYLVALWRDQKRKTYTDTLPKANLEMVNTQIEGTKTTIDQIDTSAAKGLIGGADAQTKKEEAYKSLRDLLLKTWSATNDPAVKAAAEKGIQQANDWLSKYSKDLKDKSLESQNAITDWEKGFTVNANGVVSITREDASGNAISREQQLKNDKADEETRHKTQLNDLTLRQAEIQKTITELTATQDRITGHIYLTTEQTAALKKQLNTDEILAQKEIAGILNEGIAQREKSVTQDKLDRIKEAQAKAQDDLKKQRDDLTKIGDEITRENDAYTAKMTHLQNVYDREQANHNATMANLQQEINRVDALGTAWANTVAKASAMTTATAAAASAGGSSGGGSSGWSAPAGQAGSGNYGTVNGQYIIGAPQGSAGSFTADAVSYAERAGIRLFADGGDVHGTGPAIVHDGETVANPQETSTIRRLLPILSALIKQQAYWPGQIRQGAYTPSVTQRGGQVINLTVDVSGNHFPAGYDPANLVDMVSTGVVRRLRSAGAIAGYNTL